MTSDRLKEMLQAKPFRPFGLRLADGEVIPVTHPEFLSSSPSGRTVVIFDEDDRMRIVDVFLVTSLETLPEKRPGRSRRTGSG